MPFPVAIALLSLVQGAIVALPRAWAPEQVRQLRSGWWALLPAGSVVVFAAVAGAAQAATAHTLTYVALIAVPLLAAAALGWLARACRPPAALLVLPLFALAWANQPGVAGQGAAVLLSALSCVALGAALGAVTPPRWLALGVLAMATADAALVIADLLQRPNSALNAAHPAAHLPRLQAAILGSASMGYGDLFVAGVLGGLLAFNGDRARQLRGAALAALLAGAFDLLFFVVDELPATVPVAGALVLLAPRLVWSRPARRRADCSAAGRSPL
jgi:hypothetical protein